MYTGGIKVTRKDRERYENQIVVGYCQAQTLLSGLDRLGFNWGYYGWNYDLFEITPDTCIVTGYRPAGNIRCFDLVEEYEAKAKEIREKYRFTGNYQQEAEEIRRALLEFAREAVKHKK